MSPPPFNAAAVPAAPARRQLAVAAGRLAVAEANGRDDQLPALADALAERLRDLDPREAAAVVRWAEAEGVAALIAPSLRGRIGAALAAGLDEVAARVEARARRLAEDRARMRAAWSKAGVPWRPLKGAWMAEHAYRAMHMRPMADTDLWVPAALDPTAEAALASLGYRRVATTWKHAVYETAGASVVDPRGEHEDNPRPVELHARWAEGLRGLDLDVGALVGRPTAGAAARSDPWPDPAGMLIHVAAHATVDAIGRRLRLLALVDVAVLAQAAAPETWARVAHLAGSARSARFVWPALALARRDLDAAVPDGVLAATGAGVQGRLRRWVDGVDVDSVGRHGRLSVRRDLLEIPRMWPLTPRERWTVWRWILWPPRLALADRYPDLVGSRRWPLAYARHAADSVRVAAIRWRQRRPGARPPRGR